MYVRIKRKTDTYFEDVDQNDSFQIIKERLANQLNVDSHNIQLWHSNQVKELVDLATIADQEIEHDSILYMCLRTSGRYWTTIQ